MTEIVALQEQVSRIISDTEMHEDNYFGFSEPVFSTEYDVIEINSPVQLTVTDTEGRVTGIGIDNGNLIKKEEIPDSYYFEFGGTKYLILPTNIERTTTMNGEAWGGYTLTLSKIDNTGNQYVEHEVVNATTTPNMVASFSKKNGVYSTIKTDLNNDGTYDFESTVDGELVLPTPLYSYPVLVRTISELQISATYKKLLLSTAKQAELFDSKSSENNLYSTLEKLTLKALTSTITLYKKRGILTELQAQELIKIVTFLSK
jgi:hypothetical protein